MPKISIIVPIYRVEAYLHRCIDSLLAQTFTDFELLLIDDGSPDRCGAICEEYAAKDARIRCVHQTNGGLSAARNTGLALACGEMICFVDSDDAVRGDYLALLLDALEKNDADTVECARTDIYDDRIPETPSAGPVHTTLLEPAAAMECLVRNRGFHQTVWNKLFRRSALGELRFPVGKLHEDEFFTWQVLLNCRRVAVIDAPLYYYFHRSGSIMETFSEKRLDAIDALSERHAYLAEHMPQLEPVSGTSLAMSCILMTQRLQKLAEPAMRRRCIPKLKKTYASVKRSAAELLRMPLRKSIWHILADLSLPFSAGIRNLLHRPY